MFDAMDLDEAAKDDDDMETVDLNYETDKLSFIDNRNDRRWYPGCENEFLLLNREAPEKDFYESITNDMIVKHKGVTIYNYFNDEIYTKHAEAIMTMTGFYLGRPLYRIDVFFNNSLFKTYKIQVGTSDRSIHKPHFWVWEIWEENIRSYEPDKKIATQKGNYYHDELSYLPTTMLSWDFRDNEKWIADIIIKYKQKFKTKLEMNALADGIENFKF
jgi:hypothetical protein